MFTGIVKETGVVSGVVPNVEGRRIFIRSKKLFKDMRIDDSVSVDGVCQTVVGVEGDVFEVQCVHTTLEKTTFGGLEEGARVNLELPLKFSDPLGGHLVQGHVNGVCSVNSIKRMGDNIEIAFNVEEGLSRYMIGEGSVAINGVSLTVARIETCRKNFTVSVIPHTLEVTNFSELMEGARVNVEVDMIAKYIENFLKLKENHK